MKGLIEKMTRDKRHEEGEGVGQANIWGTRVPSHGNSHCSVLSQARVQGAARRPI